MQEYYFCDNIQNNIKELEENQTPYRFESDRVYSELDIMKIEKLNENQIRATLSREDLESRRIRVSEFAYGTDAARQLFSELLRFASFKLGFDVDDTPIMVEAVPVSEESIVLIVTKVAYPEELDTRFSRFSDAPAEDGYFEFEEAEYAPNEIVLGNAEQKATDILDVTEAAEESDAKEQETEPRVIPPERYTRLFRMHSIDDLFSAAGVLAGYYHGDNTVFHTRKGYELVVHIGDHSVDEFNRVINVLSEYGSQAAVSDGIESYFGEHLRPLVAHQALQVLAQI